MSRANRVRGNDGSKLAWLASAIAVLAPQAAWAGGYVEAVMSANPTAYFRLDDTSGVVAANAVTSPVVSGTYFEGYNGTPATPMSGGTAATVQQSGTGPNLMQAGPGLPGFGVGNRAVAFTGAGSQGATVDSLRILNSATAFGNDYSYQVWVYNTVATNSQPITGYIGARATGEAFGIWGNFAGGSPGQLFVANANTTFFGTGATLAQNTWYNVAVTRSGSTLSLYVNGTSLGSTTSTVSATAPTSQNFYAAVRSDGSWGFTGRLDEVSLTNRALTAAEIKASYNAALYPTVHWSGSSGVWSTGSAWSTSGGGFTPADAGAGAGQDAVFNIASAQTIRLNGDQRVNALTFSSAGSTLLLGGVTGAPTANALQVGTSLDSGGITINAGVGAVTIGDTSGTAAAVNLAPVGNQAWTNGSVNPFTVANAVAGSAAAGVQSLTIGGSGSTGILGAITDGTAGGAIALAKVGAGVLTLSGSNGHTGGTSLDAGVLLLANRDAVAASTVTLGGGGLLFDAGVAANAFTFGGLSSANAAASLPLTNTSGSGIALTVGGNNAGTTFAGSLSGAGSLVKVGGGTLALTGSNSHAGSTTVAAGVLAISGTTALPGWNTPGRLAVASGAGLVVGNAVDDTSVATLLSTGGSFLAGSAIGFDTSAGDRTYSAALGDTAQGALGLLKAGTGMLTLTGSNTFSGPTRVAAGRLNVSGASAIRNSTLDMNAADSGTVTFGQNSTIGGLTGSRNLDLGGNTISVGDNGTSTTYSGAVTGGALTKVGAGRLTLTGNNTYAGVTTVSGGTLAIGDGGTTGSIAGSVVNDAILVFNRSDAVTYAGTISGAGGLVKQGAGALTLSGSSSYSGGTLIAGGQVIATNNASLGTGPVTLAGGRLQVNEGVTLSAPFMLDAANFELSADPGPPLIVEYLVVGGGGAGGSNRGGGGGGGGFLASSTSVSRSSSFDVVVGAGGVGSNGGASSFGPVTALGGGKGGNTFEAGANGGSGGGGGIWQSVEYGMPGGSGTTPQGFGGGRGGVQSGGGGGGAGVSGTAASGTLGGGAGGAGLSSSITGSAVWYAGGGGGGGFATTGVGGDNGGAGGQGGGGRGASGQSGTTIANAPGSPNTGGGGGGGSDPVNLGGAAGGSGIVIVRYLTGSGSATGGLVTNGTGSAAGYTLHSFTTTGTDTFTALRNSPATISGNISGTGGILKTSAVTLVLSASNSFSGTTTVSAGSLRLGHSQALGRSTFAGGAGTVSFGGLSAATFGGLTGSSALALSNTAAGAVALSVGANDLNSAYSGALSGAGSLTKIGAGVLTLSGSSTFSGPTTVTAGLLAVDGRLASGVTVQAGGMLGGSGRLASSLAGAGLVAPGNSPGILTADSFDPTGGLDLAFEFSGTGAPNYANATSSVNDVLRLTGTAPFAAPLSSSINTVSLYLPATAAVSGGVFEGGFFTDLNSTTFANFATWATSGSIVAYYQSNSGTHAYNGQTYALLADMGRSMTPGATTVSSASFGDGTVTNGQVTTFTVVVPEPGTLALAALGLGLAGRALRRRSRRRG